MIAIRNLSKKYGKKEVLKNINIQFDKGKVYGIVGENGAGSYISTGSGYGIYCKIH